jgi:hypothetical protein
VILAASARQAAAEPIPLVTVTSGAVTEFHPGAHTDLDITGTRGFSLQTTVESFSRLCSPCLVGESVTLNVMFGGSMLGVGSFDGQTYPFTLNAGGGALEFRAPTTITFPETTSTMAQFSVPFMLIDSGTLASYVLFQLSGSPEVRVNLRGSGTATLFAQVAHDPELGTLYSPVRAQYDFATPTPEPATFFLVGTALSLEWKRRRHVSHRCPYR